MTIGYDLPDGRDSFLGDYIGPCGQPTGLVGDVDGAALVGHYDLSLGGLRPVTTGDAGGLRVALVTGHGALPGLPRRCPP